MDKIFAKPITPVETRNWTSSRNERRVSTLKIPEVWFWEDGVLEVYHLRLEGKTVEYQRVSGSEEVKGIDLELLLRCINMVNHVDAIKTFQQALQK